MTPKHTKILPALWGALLLLTLILMFSHTYNDIVITTRQGINLWDILFQGKMLDFYQLNTTTTGNPNFPALQGCAYNILVYVIFALWNIPLALLSAFSKVDVMNNILCLAYAKLLPVAAMLVTAWLLRRILVCLDVPENGRRILSYLYLSSALMVSTVFITAQYDLLGVVFQLLGLLFFLKKDHRKFILCFGIAFCFKYFSLVIFLPLLLLVRKRIWPVLKSLAGMCLPLLLTKLPFLFAASGSEALFGESLGLHLLARLLDYRFDFMSLFLVVYILILVWCYLHGGEEQMAAQAIWACFASYAAFFGLCNAYPYWAVLLAPFLVLAIAMRPQMLYLNLILETAGLAALVVLNMFKFNWCYFGDTMRAMLMPLLFPGAGYENSLIFSLISVGSHPLPQAVFNSLFIGAMITLAYTAYPRRGAQNLEAWESPEDCRDILILRTLIVSILCLLPIFSLFV